jgi:hypothetical protein
MINLKAILSALIVIAPGSPQPILLQLLDKVINIVNNPDTDTWVSENFMCMQHIYIHVFAFVDRIVTLVFSGALNFANVNLVTFERPMAEFDLTDYNKAVAVYKALHDQFNLHQSQNTPISVSQSVVIRYIPDPGVRQPACSSSGQCHASSGHPATSSGSSSGKAWTCG